MPEVEVLFSPTFEQDIDELEDDYPGALDEVEKLVASLKRGEKPGNRVQGVGKPAYKVRLPNRAANRGKSGGFRVIYYVQMAESIWLVTMYSKTRQADISPQIIRSIIDKLVK